MVMAYEQGQTLHDYIEQQHLKKTDVTVNERVIRQIFIQTMDALREVHAKKLLHLDLKPANIYLRNDGTPILLDFGAARRTLQADLSQLHPMYTPGFAAPELHTKKDLGPWTDIYSLGAAMFNCMTGFAPQAANERKKQDRMEHDCRACSGVYSSLLIQLIRWSLMLDPLQRPQSVFNLQNALRHTASNEQGVLSPHNLLSQLKRWMKQS
jgi:serine/threonine protein kinase